MWKIEHRVCRHEKHSFAPRVAVACVLLLSTALASPTIVLSKKIGPPTSKILVSGSGFAPNVGVDIYFDTKDEALVVTNGKGEFHDAAAYAPKSALPGEHWVTALERNNDKGDHEPFVVNTNWRQFHFSPDQDGFNSYENVLKPSNVSSLGVRWRYSTGGNVYSSPAIVDGVAYVGVVNSNGGVYALQANTGALLWTYPNAVGVPGSPAVSGGVVYACSADGYVSALDARTGALKWKYGTIGFNDTGLTVANGVVYAGSDDSNVYALDAETGALRWKYNTGRAVVTSPAVANGVVYIGNANVLALDANTGALLWSFEVVGAVFSSPAVEDGVVYVGSGGTDGYLYALNASTGAFLWKYPAYNDGNATAAPLVSNGVVYLGSTDYYLYAMDGITGALIWQDYLGDPIEGDPAIANGVVYVGDYDGNAYSIEAATGTLLWVYSTGGGINTPLEAPAVANGVVYFGKYQGDVYAFSLSGSNAREAKLATRPDTNSLQPDLTLRPFRSTTPAD
jgi:outer membrane protein assembly factor BamB